VLLYLNMFSRYFSP